jgi:chromosome segregation ATPase
MKSKILCLLVLVIFLLTACSSREELDQANQLITDLQAQLAQKDTDYQQMVAEKDGQFSDSEKKAEELSARVSELEKAIGEKQTELDAVHIERDILDEKVDTLNKQLVEKDDLYFSAKRQVDKLVCSQKLSSMKYNNLIDASTIMSAWWAQQPNVKRVTGSYRDKIWSNALTGIHGINYIYEVDNQEYVEHFLVYFDDFGMKPGVFWIKGQCWLDTP